MKKILLTTLLTFGFINADIITILSIDVSTEIRFGAINGPTDHTFNLTQANANTVQKVDMYLEDNSDVAASTPKITFNGDSFLVNNNGNKIEMEYQFTAAGGNNAAIVSGTPIPITYSTVVPADGITTTDSNGNVITPATSDTENATVRRIGQFSVKSKNDLTLRNYKAGTYRGVLTTVYTTA